MAIPEAVVAEARAVVKALYKAVAVAVTVEPAVAVMETPPTVILTSSPEVVLPTVAVMELAALEEPIEAAPMVTVVVAAEAAVPLLVNVTVPSELSVAV